MIKKAININLLFVLILYSLFCNAQPSDHALSETDSLKLKLETAKTDSSKMFFLNKLSIAYMGEEPSMAIYYENKAIELASLNNNPKLISENIRKLGNIYFKLSYFDKSIYFYLRALKISEQANDSLNIIFCLNNLANVYSHMAQVSNPTINYQKSISYHNKAIEIIKTTQDHTLMNNLWLNVSNAYVGLGQYDTAISCLQRALKGYKEVGGENGINLTKTNLAEIYLQLGEKEKNKKYIQIAESYFKEVIDKMQYTRFITGALMNMGRIRYGQKNYSEAITYYLAAYKSAKSGNGIEEIKDIALGLANTYEKTNNYAEALKYHQLYSEVKDSLLDDRSNKLIAEMNFKYDSDKKEKDIQLLTKDKELQKVEISRQKLIRNGIVIGLLVTLFMFILLFNRFVVTRKQKEIIARQNMQIYDGINYSKKIQEALLPSIESLQNFFADVFVYYAPKDIVSGDFYFFKKLERYTLLACVDCTGHGVPGGFMSTVGTLLLDKITNNPFLRPNEILNQLSNEIIRLLHQEQGGPLQDGMDLSLCLIDKSNMTIDFCGARNGIIIVSDEKVSRYKASAMPVGGRYMKKGKPIERNFETQQIQLKNNDWVFLYTDGYIEQIGGEAHLPMTYEQFCTGLKALSNINSPNEKINSLKSGLDSWRGINEQTDDVLVLGFKIV